MEKTDNTKYIEQCTLTDKKEKEAAYWLCNIEGIGGKTIRKMLQTGDSPTEIFAWSEKKAAAILKPKACNAFLAKQRNWDLEKEYEIMEKKGICFSFFMENSFPSRLTNLADAPAGIFYKGTLPKDDVATLAIIGARNCSEYGRKSAVAFAAAATFAKLQVISGLARGIDGIAQRAVLEREGNTFAVLGCGVDVCYPMENQDSFEKMPKYGGVIAEYPPGTLPRPQHFPMRNRIISAFSDTILVVEAKQKSGTQITVDMALEQGKDVYAVPGRIQDALSAGCNELIRQGAGIATEPNQFVQTITNSSLSFAMPKTTEEKLELDETEYTIYQILKEHPASVTELMEKLTERGVKVSVQELSYVLVMLSLKGIIEETRGGRYSA